MHKIIIGYLIIFSLLGIEAEAQNLPTYDATGTWIISDTNVWTDCPGDAVQPESDTISISQTGRIFIVHTDEGINTGTVNGSTYLMIRSYPQQRSSGEFGSETETVTVTLLSATNGTGKYQGTWSASDGSITCSWGSNFDISRKTIDGPKKH